MISPASPFTTVPTQDPAGMLFIRTNSACERVIGPCTIRPSGKIATRRPEFGARVTLATFAGTAGAGAGRTPGTTPRGRTNHLYAPVPRLHTKDNAKF